jgi:hypothetical protein
VLAYYFEPEIANEMMDPIAFLAKLDPDILYYHQAMKAKDAKEFCQAMQGEVNSHRENNHWEIIRRNKVPEGVKVLDSVWAMRHKRCIKTKEVYKWKARLNIHGGQQEYGMNYWETFSPLPCGYMGLYQTCPHFVYFALVAHLSDRFCTCLSSGTH